MSPWRSMTGYARLEATVAGWRLTLEARSVNARGLDLRIRTEPRRLDWEHELAALLRTRLHRGKVEVNLRALPLALGEPDANWWRLRGLRLRQRLFFGVAEPLDLARGGDGAARGPAFATWREVAERLIAALEADRAREGAGLARVVAELGAELNRALPDLERLTAAERDVVAARLRERLAELASHGLEAPDRDRIASEVALWVARGDVREELDRLRLHLQRFHELATTPSPVGRSLDVLIQEIGRELHTIGSKAHTGALRERVLALRLVVERLREQVQNIE